LLDYAPASRPLRAVKPLCIASEGFLIDSGWGQLRRFRRKWNGFPALVITSAPFVPFAASLAVFRRLRVVPRDVGADVPEVCNCRI
jgi:hypothetical protein